MTQPHQPYPHQYQPYGARPPIPPKKKRWPLVVGLVCGIPIALIILVTVISVAAGSGDTSTATSAPPPAPAAVAPGAPAPAASAAPAASIPPAADGLFQHPEDVTVASCERDATLGWPKASIRIVNQSGKASTYSVRVSFQSQDGKSQYGEGFAAVSSLAPGQETTQTAQGLNDVPAGAPLACVVTSAQRTEAL